jgi:hypothetical protein
LKNPCDTEGLTLTKTGHPAATEYHYLFSGVTKVFTVRTAFDIAGSPVTDTLKAIDCAY